MACPEVWRFHAVFAVAAAATLSGCPNIPIPAGNLAVPGALAAAPSSLAPGGEEVVFIAEGDGEDVKAFTTGNHEFVRGPNGINALSIPLILTMNGQTFDTFRPTRLAGGAVAGTGGATLGYAIVTGTANPPRLAIIDAQTFETSVGAADAAACAAGKPSVSCLPAQALDVATANGEAFALLAPDATGTQSFIVMTPSVEKGGPVLTLTSGPTPITIPGGGPALFSRMAVSADGQLLYLGNLLATEVLQVPVTNPANSIFYVDQALMTAQPSLGIRVPVLSPAYVAPGGTNVTPYLLGVLTDGRVVTLDISSNSVPAMAVALDGNGNPLVPMDFNMPAIDIAFMPCTNSQCQTTIRTSTSATIVAPAAGFVALGNGTVAPIVPCSQASCPSIVYPDGKTLPQIYRPINNVGGPSATGAIPSAPVGTTTLTVAALATGVTQSETVTVTFDGELPGYEGRSGTLTAKGSGQYVLQDSLAAQHPDLFTAGLTAMAPCPAVSGKPCLGDLVQITDLSGACPQISKWATTLSAVVAATMTTPVQAVLSASLPCTPSRVAYDVLAAADVPANQPPRSLQATCPNPPPPGFTCGPWLVSGSVSGYMGRAIGSLSSPGFPFTYAGVLQFYTDDTPPSPLQDLVFTIFGSNPLSGGIYFSFSTTSGYQPFTLTSSVISGATLGLATTYGLGLAYGLAAVNQANGSWLYTTNVGANALVEINIPNYDTVSGGSYYQ